MIGRAAKRAEWVALEAAGEDLAGWHRRGSLRSVRKRVITTAVLTLALVPASAVASDVSATHAYLQANYLLSRATVGIAPAQHAATEALNSRLARECPRAGAGSPITEVTEPMSYEVAVALWSVSYGTTAGPIQTFVRAVKPLHWSNRRITRLARAYATKLHEMATLPMPDLCTDVRAWTASHFQVVPANVLQLDRHAEAIGELNPVPQKLLAPFERGGDAALAARARALEVKAAEIEFVKGQDTLIQVTETLGLPE
jgi:hypothetical protein